MRRHIQSFAILATSTVVLAGCLAEEPEHIDQTEQEIAAGYTPSGTAASLGLGISDANCSFTFLTTNMAVTAAKCAESSSRVTVGSETHRIRSVHSVVDGMRNSRDKAGVVAVSFKQPFKSILAALPPGSGGTFERSFDPTPVSDGETLSCYGYTNGRVSWGYFHVTDSSGSGTLSLLEGGTSTAIAVKFEDLGGYCIRDGGTTEVAGILIAESTGGTPPMVSGLPVHSIATALRTHDLNRGAAGIKSIGRAVDFGAIRLVDANGLEMITAQFGTENATLEPRLDPNVDDDRIQAFYRELVPRGGGYLVRLVDVASGECLTRRSGRIVLSSCDPALSEQLYHEHSEYLDNRDRYSYFFNNEAIDYSQSPLIASQWSGTAEQRFLMWLTPY